LDGLPGYAAVADLRETVFGHLSSISSTAGNAAAARKLPQSADELRILDGSGNETLRDDVVLRQVPSFAKGFVVMGTTLPRDSIRRPWFLPSSDVVLDDLKSAPELNGQAALVSDWIADRGRYEVLVTAVGIRDIKHVKPDNLRRASAKKAREYVPEGFGAERYDEVDEVWRVVFNQKVVVRAEPSTQGRILDSRKPGDRVRVCRRKGEWVQLHPSEGFGAMPAWLLTDGAAKGLGRLLELEEVPAAPMPPQSKPSPPAGGYPQPAAKLEAGWSKAAPGPQPASAPAVAPKPQPSAASAAASRARRLSELQEELERVEMDKAAAIEDEDYDLAAEMKQRKKELEAEIEEVESSAADEASARLEALREELQQVKAKKLDAVEEEDFKAAAALKKRQVEIEAEVRQFEAGGA